MSGLRNLSSFVSVQRVEGRFFLKKKDIVLVEFEILVGALEQVSCRIVKDYGVHELLPYNFVLEEAKLMRWLESRFIPKNRAFVEKIMETVSHDGPRIVRLLKATLGLSLIDDYWVTENESLEWAKFNLYDNEFSNTLSLIAFTGYADKKVNGLSSSPEYTTDGMLRKSWRRTNGGIFLYKGGTEGYVNAGLEPYSEFYAAQVAEAMGLFHVPYSLEKWKGVLCSVCPLFTSKDYSYVNAATVLGETSLLEAMVNTLDSEHIFDIIEMAMFDFIVANKDRHAGNYGWLRDNNTGKLISVAPIFDNGDSLCSYALDDELNDLEGYLEDKQVTAFYFGANSLTLRDLLDKKMKNKVRTILNFEFKKDTKYNLPDRRLKAIQSLVRERARMLL